MDFGSYYLIMLILTIGNACIFGVITKVINERKGYYGGFAWGFWLGWIGIIVVACRQAPFYTSKESIIVHPKKSGLPHNAIANSAPSGGGWKCSCGRINAAYISSCVCGLNKHAATAATEPIPASNDTLAADETKVISLLKEYKELLDSGVITQEEFDAKKKSILSR